MSSKIIRSGKRNIQNMHFDQLPEEVTARVVGDSGRCQGTKLVQEATLSGESIIQEAKTRSIQIEQDAYNHGYQDGLDAARGEAGDLLSSLCTLVASAQNEKWNYINRIEGNIIDLAIEIAGKIVDEQVSVRPEIVLNIAKKALLIAAEREHLEIRVNPADLELMKKHKDDLMSSMDGIQKIELIADRRIAPGGCSIETAVGNVDARIQSQLTQLDSALKGVVNDG